MKIKVLQAYEWRLQERNRRKEFAIERGLVDFRRVQANEKKMSKEDREIHFKFRPFARFISHEDFEELVQGAIRERNLRNRIEQLKHYRAMGITSLEEAEKYEHERKKRETEMDTRRGRRSLYGGQRARKAIDDPFTTPVTPVSENVGNGVTTGPGSDLLSNKERELCTVLRLHPHRYMVVKDALMRESFRLGNLTKNTALKMFEGTMDQESITKLYDYFALCGWIKTGNSTTT